MKNLTAILAVIIAINMSACTNYQTVHLMDGRVFRAKVVMNNGQCVQFKANGWEYSFPSYLVISGVPAKSIMLRKIEITKDAIKTPGAKLSTFEDLIKYLDNKATRSSPILLILPDTPSWTESRRQQFGKAYGDTNKRPDVGIENYWPKKWLPGDPGRESMK